jgi:hypothetical protein
VIVSSAGFLGESVIPGVTGTVLENDLDAATFQTQLTTAIGDFFTTKERSIKMGSAARANAESNHGWRSRALEHIQIYGRALDPKLN